VKIGAVDPEIALLKLKKKKLWKVKHIARSAGLPSGLKNREKTSAKIYSPSGKCAKLAK